MAGRNYLNDDWFSRLREVWDAHTRAVRGNLEDEPSHYEEPDDVVVLTPAGGIPARSGLTIYSELCDAYSCTDSATAGQATLALIPDYQLRVYNLWLEAVPGSARVVTSRLKSGHRYVSLASCAAETA